MYILLARFRYGSSSSIHPPIHAAQHSTKHSPDVYLARAGPWLAGCTAKQHNSAVIQRTRISSVLCVCSCGKLYICAGDKPLVCSGGWW